MQVLSLFQESAFFNIPEEGQALKSFVDGISAKGGQGDAACALEAISLALKSDFNTLSLKLHGIIVFAPGSALRLGLRKNYPSYPEGMPRDLNELFEWWERGVPGGSFSPSAGRFVVLAPDVYPWRGMEVMNRFWPIFSNAGHNLGDVDMQTVYDLFIGDF